MIFGVLLELLRISDKILFSTKFMIMFSNSSLGFSFNLLDIYSNSVPSIDLSNVSISISFSKSNTT